MTSTDSTTKNFLCKKEIDELKVIKRRKLTNKEEVKIYHEQQNKEESKVGSSEESEKTAKEEQSQNTANNSSSSQLPQKRKSGGEKEEPLIKYIFFKSLVCQAQKGFKKRLDDKVRWPFLPEQCPKLVQLGERCFTAADKLDDLPKRYLLYLRGATHHLRAGHTLDNASRDASVLYKRTADRLKSLKECYRMTSEITTNEKVIYILGLRCLSAIHERLLILSSTETAEDQIMQMELILSSHLAWNSANEESNNECDEFFAEVSADVGYKLEQQSCIGELIRFVDSSIKKLRRFYR